MTFRNRFISAILAVSLLSGCAAQGNSASPDIGTSTPAPETQNMNATASDSTAPTSADGTDSAAVTSTGITDADIVAPQEVPAEQGTEQTSTGDINAQDNPTEQDIPAAQTSVQNTTTLGTPAVQNSPAEQDDPAAQDFPAGQTTATTSKSKPAQTEPKQSSKPSANVGDSNLSATGSGLEGSKSTGSYNYGEALQKAILFYELQRSGDIDEKSSRTNWRGDSGMNDGADVGLDLTGGLYDAGDNVKFNLPMAYTAAILAWSVYEDRDVYEKSGQSEYITDTIRWVNDYLMKCHPQDDVYYYQVGNGSADHAWWGAAEVMQMERPSYKVDINHPGSAVVAEAAASLAACAAVMKSTDKAYADKCLKHAKQLYDFAERTKSDSGYTMANGFYNSWSGFYDELSWAGCWLYLATGEKSYLDKAKQYETQAGGNYKWTMCWDDTYTGAVCLLAGITGEQKYRDKIEKNLDWWTTGTGGERVTYSPKGLAWLDSWGSLRYATTAGFVAAVYADYDCCPASKAKTYRDFCASQVDYALGSTGRSFVVGFGTNPPEHPHHRTAQGSWADNMNEPNYHRHTLYGALVGGPDASDSYTDSVSDYNKNEVACDYNAGFVGALAKMYGRFGGQTIKNFGAIEEKGEELYVEQRVNAQGNGFTEIKAMVYNKTAWPARVTDDLELRYFIDLTELYEAGGSASDVTVSMNYSDGAKFGGLYEWNKAKHIYYVSIDFSGVKIYPGGQSAYKKEVQFRMLAPTWDPDNDPSYVELVGTNGSELLRAAHVGLYEGGTLVFGTTPDGKSAGLVKPSGNSGNSGNSGSSGGNQQQNQQPQNQNSSADKGGLTVSMNGTSGGRGNTIQFTIDIVNNTGSAVDLSKLELDYFFTADGKTDINFWCDYSATSGDNYTAMTDSVKGTFSVVSGKKTADRKCAITFSSGTLSKGGTLTVQVRVTPADWTEFDLSNDYSGGGAEKLCVKLNGKKIFGSEP